MLIPWSHDSSQLRRKPWITYGLVVACLAAFFATWGMDDARLGEAEEGLWDAYAYWEEHPYLPANDRLVRAFGPLDAETVAYWEANGGVLPDVLTIEAEAAELFARIAVVEENLEGHAWYQYGLVPARPKAVGLVGHMFLHGGLAHLIGNLWFLILAGPYIEDRWGRGLFSAFYLASGLAGAALFVAFQPQFDGPLIGASGAVSGILGAFVVCCRKVRIKFVYWIIFPGTFTAPAWVMVPLWFANELASALTATDGSGVAYWAHVGGFTFGTLAALGIRAAGLESKLSSDLGELATDAGHPVLDRTRAFLQAGQIDEAIGQANEAISDGNADELSVRAYMEAIRAGGREHDAPRQLSDHLWAAIEWRKKDAAVALWKALGELGVTPSGNGEALLQMAGWLRGANLPTEARFALQGAMVGANSDLAVRVARAARRADPLLVRRAAQAAIASPTTPAADRKAMEALLQESGVEAQRRGWIMLDAEERVEKGRGRPVPVVASPDALELADSPAMAPVARAPAGNDDVLSPESAADILGPDHGALDLGSPDVAPPEDPGATRMAAPRLEHGQAIDVSDILGEDEAPPIQLPDPEQAGSEVFLDSLHATLEAEGLSEDDLETSQPELTPEPVAPNLGEPGGAEMFDHGAEDLGGSAEPALLGAADPAAPVLAEPAPPGVAVPATVAEPAMLAVPAAAGEEPIATAEPIATGDPLFGEEDLVVMEEEKGGLPPRRPLRLMPAVPLGLDATHLTLDVEGRGRSRLSLERIDAVSVAGVGGISPSGKPVLLLDLCLNWTGYDELQVVRMRSDAFDPRKIIDAEGSPLKALRAFAAQLIMRSRGVSLPEDADVSAAFKIFATLPEYQREVLRAAD